jgi:hypothetical protein
MNQEEKLVYFIAIGEWGFNNEGDLEVGLPGAKIVFPYSILTKQWDKNRRLKITVEELPLAQPR